MCCAICGKRGFKNNPKGVGVGCRSLWGCKQNACVRWVGRCLARTLQFAVCLLWACSGSVHGPWPLLLRPAASRACAWVRTLELIAQDPNLLNISVLQQGGHPTYSGTARTLPCCTSTLLDRACASALLFAGCSRLLLIRRRGALFGLPARLRGVARSSNRSFPRVFWRPWFLLVRLWTVG